MGDTIGVASPRQVALFLEQAVKRYDISQIALHFHDTRGMALANVLESLNYGVVTFDSSLGGLGDARMHQVRAAMWQRMT